MRVVIAGILGLISSICVAQAQQQPAQQLHRVAPARDGGVREVLESIVIPPIPNAPFTATLQTEWVRYAGEGATVTVINERHIARDGLGRIYEERWDLVPKYGKIKSQMEWIQIADPQQRTLYNCSIRKQVCELRHYDPTKDLTAAVPRKPIPLGATGNDRYRVEDLGTMNIAGIEVLGRRENRTIEVGSMGNDQPLQATNETWHSQELGLNLLSIRTSPMFGKQTFTVTELSATEPEPQLFQLPTGYKVVDIRKNPNISW